ncbi:hypothetical protein CUMW_084020 [Citrus unshiu]|nr:hypothetical protein CUMW_084020 [Citrus unshiu]
MAEAAIVQAVGSVLTPAVEGGRGIFHYLKLNYGYVKHLKRNFVELEKELTFLCDCETEVNEELNSNKTKKKMTQGCKLWLDSVKKVRDEFEILRSKYQQTGGCLCGKRPIHSQLKLGKQTAEMVVKIRSLRTEIGQIIKMEPKPPDPFVSRHASKFPSHKEYVETLEKHLSSDGLKKICIWGPLGVGKTTIMENSHDSVGESGLFDIIFWVNVNTDGNISDIQEIILERLKVNAKELNNAQRADNISKELEDKRYVLFLDGVSSEINFKDIGIHDDHRHGKVVFACRSREFCWQADDDIHVKQLSEKEAKKLFWEVVGVRLKNNPDIKLVADSIVNECGGLPYILKLIGNELANVSSASLWRATLYQLRSPSMEEKEELEEVYRFFRLVYNKLAPELKPCLLGWASFPSGCELHQDYIIDCWRAQNFLTRFKKFRDARDQGHDILDKFDKKSLLQKGSKVTHYKMFEFFQRVALRIANENGEGILVKEKEHICEEEWKDTKRLSLFGFPPSTLPDTPSCCGILTLILQERRLERLPSSFFEYMCHLQLLDLHNTNISCLPPSISRLINLNALFLHSCSLLLQLPAEIGCLQKLEILDVRHTRIQCLPSEIGQLIKLKCLRLSWVENVGNHNLADAGSREIISSNIISKLHLLEELIIEVPDPTDGRWKQNVESIAGEIAALEQLTTLCFYFPTIKCFETFINRRKLVNGNNPWQRDNFRSFNILVGYQQSTSPFAGFDVSECSAEKHLRFSAGVEEIPVEVLTILKQAYSFELIGYQYAVNLSNFGVDNLVGLEACIIEDCNEMTSIIDGNRTGGFPFQSLNKLHISNLPKLMHIWEGSVGSESLNSLTTLTLKKCHSIKTLFSKNMVVQLNKLQNLQVEDCQMIEEIVEDGAVLDTGVFPKLKTLELTDLPKLSTICNSPSLVWPSLETIMIKTCEELKSFPSTFKNTAKLKVIVGNQTWFDQLDWQNCTDLKVRFQGILQSI